MEEQVLGSQRFRVEGKLIIMSQHGPLTAPDVQAMLPIYDEHIALHGGMLLLINLTHAQNPTPEARRTVIDWLKRTGHTKRVAVAVFGNRAQNIMITLLTSAARMLTGSTLLMKVFSDEAAARRWLAERESAVGR